MYWVGTPRTRCAKVALNRDASSAVRTRSGCAKRWARSQSSTNIRRVSAVSRGEPTDTPLRVSIAARRDSSRVVIAALHGNQAIFAVRFEFLCFEMRYQSIHEHFDLAIHHALELVQREADAMIRYAILRKVVGANFFAAVAGLDLGAALLGESRLLLLHFDFIEPGTQHAHTFFAVLNLRLLVLAAHDRVGRDVR